MPIAKDCAVCQGIGIVCESHPFAPWDDSMSGGCECSAGMACVCNKDHELPPDSVIIISVDTPDKKVGE